MTAVIEYIGVKAIRASVKGWGLFVLSWQMLVALFERVIKLQFRFRETMDQMYAIGVQSLPVMIFSLTFVGVVITLEMSFHMKMVIRDDALVPAFSTLFLLRELGPVITCLLLCSRVGASIAAEVATMKVTDQIDALRILAIDPVEYLVIPRWVATVVAAVCISVISVVVSILAGAAIASSHLGISTEQYFSAMFTFARFEDFRWVFLKATVFGSIIPVVAIHQGLSAHYGAEGVGDAATGAVVQGTLFIIIADFVLTYLLYAYGSGPM